MLKLVSKTICLSLIGSFTAVEAFQKHQKDGFFIEAGFETGLLQGTQTQEQTIATTQEKPKPKPKPKPITPQSTYGKYYISQSTILKNATELFAENNITNLTFYSLTPVYVTAYNQESAEEADYGNNSLIMIQNFLPYNLNNIELSYTDDQGKVVSLGVIETIPKQSQIILPASLFNDPQLNADGFQQLQTTTTKFSDSSTQNLFDKLSKVTTNLQMTYINHNQFSSGNGTGSKPPCPPYENQENCVAKVPPFTSQDAKNLTNLMLNMMAVFDSKSWEDAVKNAPFEFSDNNLSAPCFSNYSTCVNPYNDGLVDPKLIAKYSQGEYNIENGQVGSVILTPQDVIYSYRVTNNLYVNLLPTRGGDLGLGSQYGGPNGPGDDGTNFGALGILSPFLDPEILFGKELNKVAIMQLRDIIHEYGHTLGYTHNGNMTYQRVRMCEENNGPEERCQGGKIEQVNGQEVQVFDNGKEVRDTDGSTYDVCSRFGGQGQPAFPSSYPNSIYTDCSQVPAGLIGVTSAVWQQLIDQNALPVDYTNLSSQTNYLNASLNTQDFATTMLSAISQSLSSSKSSATTYRTSKTSRPFGAPLLGVNLKMGYQKYFNDYLGLSSYGIIKYNYAQANNEKIQQLSYGVGMDVLFDFITNYTNEKNPKNNLTKRVFTSSLGVFGGLRGLYNSYYLLNQYKGSGNLNVTGGLNYRYKHSKYSIGISVPLIQLKSRVVSSDGAYTNSITLNEGGSHFKVFFNYGWVF
ncbi:outer membrane beta-barrel protein [Helicobacter pylori]|uniref:outer membrane beta-barrel protein n=1 Tax=Helicobacter pylori TaxID=210 RepID=UPI000EB55F89|nr:outer membrane beta-barrel protein [Helicobacter pylori]